MSKIINPPYCDVARGVFHAKGQPQNIPRSTGMSRALAAPYGIVESDLYELEQRVIVMCPDEIKDTQDENP